MNSSSGNAGKMNSSAGNVTMTNAAMNASMPSVKVDSEMLMGGSHWGMKSKSGKKSKSVKGTDKKMGKAKKGGMALSPAPLEGGSGKGKKKSGKRMKGGELPDEDEEFVKNLEAMEATYNTLTAEQLSANLNALVEIRERLGANINSTDTSRLNILIGAMQAEITMKKNSGTNAAAANTTEANQCIKALQESQNPCACTQYDELIQIKFDNLKKEDEVKKWVSQNANDLKGADGKALLDAATAYVTRTLKITMPDIPAGGAKPKGKKQKTPKGKGKKGGALVDDIKNLAVPFAILLAKQGLEGMFSDKKAEKKSGNMTKRKTTMAGGACGCSSQQQSADLKGGAKKPKGGAKKPTRSGRSTMSLAQSIDNFLRKY